MIRYFQTRNVCPRCALIGLLCLGTIEPSRSDEYSAPSAAEALARLKRGNERFVSGEVRHGRLSEELRNSLVDGQHPFAVIVGCSDSRVPTELVFDQSFGDLFVIRNAGNIIATDVLGSIEYAIAHLGCNLVLVMGHESCGAVTAALMKEDAREKEPLEVQDVLQEIVVGLDSVELPVSERERVPAGVEANVRWSVKQLTDLMEERGPKQIERVRMAGAVYELHTGKVRFLD